MKRVIFIGNIGCGKTTLSQAILGKDLVYKKTQAVEVLGENIIDTPGEYLEMKHYRGALMITSADAELLGFVQSAIDDKAMFPPSYAGSFAKKAIGVVSKIDRATKEQIERAESWLKMAGVERVFKISSKTGEGMKALMDYLNDESD